MDKKRVFIRYLIGPREFAQRAKMRDFVGPFTTCEAQMWSSGLTQLFLHDVVTDPIRILTFHSCGTKYVLCLLCQINFISIKSLKEFGADVNFILDNSISSRHYQNWPKHTYG